ncbi:MAG: acyl-CoA synthetase [Deltaproteobacteria bacterium]|nr:MAG: acyl-CoA synthetase [Deltaproteobacteria bacterium]
MHRAGGFLPEQPGNQKNQTPELFNLASYCLEPNVRARPHHPALVFASSEGKKTYTYSEVAEQVARLMAQLTLAEAHRGDRILLRLSNSPTYAFAFLAAAGAGLVAVPVSPQLSSEEVQFLLNDSEARWVWTTHTFLEREHLVGQATSLLVEEAPPAPSTPASFANTPADEPAYLVYTSGTTARPKGVLHAQRSVWGRRPMQSGWTDFQQTDVVLHAGQLNWTYTMGVGLFDVWAAGGTAVIFDGPNDPTRWPGLIQEHQVSVFAAVPSVLRQILKYNTDSLESLSSLRHALTAGEALRPHLLEQWRDLVGCELYEALGMSECSTYISSGPSTAIRPGSPGKPQEGRKVAILPSDGGTTPLPPNEIGLLAIHRTDPGLMLGYWNRPEEEADVFRGEWFVGGDLASFDEDGYVWFHGRNNDLMNALGYRVSPLEVEQTLERHPSIREVGVTECQVRDDLSVICAWFVPESESLPSEQDLSAWCQEHLAAYKCPREWRRVDALPRTRSGKLQRQQLQQFQRSSQGPWVPPKPHFAPQPGPKTSLQQVDFNLSKESP